MKKVLRDIKDGTHAKKWIAEYRSGAPNLYAQRAKEQNQPIEQVGRKLREMMPWLPKRDVPQQAAPAQAPGASLSAHAKFLVAKALADLGVDVVEAGFPAASAGEAEAVARIAREVRGPTIAALARANQSDVETAGRALSSALRSRIHVFIATSDVHLDKKLRISRSECLARTTAAVARATELADEVEFSAEDATRSDVDFLNAVYQAAAQAGARTMNIPDTVGYSQPQEFAALVLAVRSALTSFNRVAFSVHCHNDLGLAVANTLAAIEAGVDQAHVTINGLGERGGNASLEETVMALRTRW